MPASDPSAWVVHKFGGSSVADADCFRKVADILESQPARAWAWCCRPARGVTDALLALVDVAEEQDDGLSGQLRGAARRATPPSPSGC